MKNIKEVKENIILAPIVLLSAVLNFVNLSIEGTANSYYAAAVKSMTLSLKNFFFVSFDPAAFVTIDKPPLGFWFQAISAKIFGYSGWSILFPQALAGVLSVIVVFKIVKRSFGRGAAFISSLCLAITPVFVAVSRNNTVDNMLVLFLLLACWSLSIAAEKGKIKYLIISMILVGLGFNIKMLQAYMVAPALYITYLLSNAISFRKRIVHLIIATIVLFSVSLSWALIVDSTPASSRPYIDSSTNNSVMELILGHNGLERIGFSDKSSRGGTPDESNGARSSSSLNMQNTDDERNVVTNSSNSKNTLETQMPGNFNKNNQQTDRNQSGNGMPPSNIQQIPNGGSPPNIQNSDGINPPSMRSPDGGNNSRLKGSFGGETTASICRLFSKNILSDQIVWFIPVAIFGFIAASIKENLKVFLDNKRKQALILWFMWFLPEFIYFSYNTGTFHPYYLTMLAPPIAALARIGITSMWQLYKNGGWQSWFLPTALIINGVVQMLMLYYFINSSIFIKILMILLGVLCFLSSIILIILNVFKRKNIVDEVNEYKTNKIKKAFAVIAVGGLLLTPFTGSSATMFYRLNGSIPAAGLELLSTSKDEMQNISATKNNYSKTFANDNKSSKLIQFLLKNKTKDQKYLLVVSSSNNGSEIIINTGEAVMSLGGFLGSNNAITLEAFRDLVKKGEVRYVMTGGDKGGSSEIMNWVKENGTLVSSNEYSNTTETSSSSNEENTNSQNRNVTGPGDRNLGGLYDLKAYTDNSKPR